MPTDKESPKAFRFELTGQEVATARTPGLLATSARSTAAGTSASRLLDCVKPVASYDLSPASRAAAGGPRELEADAGSVIALELEGGFTLLTSPERLSASLTRVEGEERGAAASLDLLRDRSGTTRGAQDWVAGALTLLHLEPDEIYQDALEKAKAFGAATLLDKAERISTWAGTKALMWAIERKVGGKEGLYRWVDDLAPIVSPDAGTTEDPAEQALRTAAGLVQEASEGPLLIFVHGTASSTAGSFGDFRSVDGEQEWGALSANFGRRIFAFEHRTFSQSPIENALTLAQSLPAKARLCLVTHSRGGLVGDLLCLPALPAELVAKFGRAGDDAPADPVLAGADERDRQDLLELGQVLAEKQFIIERYVRVACPARGSLLLSSNLDAFLSALLHLVGLIPGWTANPLYAGLQRIVLEIAKNRTEPKLVPGIEAMLPESPLTRFLMLAEPAGAGTPPPALPLALIAGDIQGDNPLKRLGVFLTDSLFFEHRENDLVVETDSMFGGLARAGHTRYRFEQGRDVSHFRYFTNRSSRRAIKDWLTSQQPLQLAVFSPYTTERRNVSATERAVTPAAPSGSQPVVFVLPGIMGSHLRLGRDRVWFDFLDLANGGLAKIRAGVSEVAPDDLFEMFYGDLAEYLAQTHQVRRFPYDWRESIFAAAGRLAVEVDAALQATEPSGQPIRLLAHSMGGLVVRAMIQKFPRTWERLMQRAGARFVMLGTPNRGSHLMVEQLLGKASTIRQLAALDMRHDLQELIDIVAAYRGALQLLPRAELRDASGKGWRYFQQDTWREFGKLNRESWFRQVATGVPAQALLTEVEDTWKALPEALPNRGNILYVAGQATNTAFGVDVQGDRLRMMGTPKGDGSVTWESGLLDGIESWYMPGVPHGELADTSDHFPALLELLLNGTTARLPKTPPVLRAPDQIVTYDAGPVLFPTAEEFARGVLGARPRTRMRRQVFPKLYVSCRAADLRYALDPVLVGHYINDAISGAEERLDQMLGRALSMRKHLGFYASDIGTAIVVLPAANPEERRRGSNRGAVVIGLGSYDSLTTRRLTESARAGAMRYLLQWVDNQGSAVADGDVPEIGLASLLIGFNSTTNLSIEDSVYAVVRGVAEASRKFSETMETPLRISRLEFVECYLDTALSAARALQRVAERLTGEADQLGVQIDAAPHLLHGEGIRPRLDAARGNSYWPRLMVTDADRRDTECPPECYDTDPAPLPATQVTSMPGRPSDTREPTAVADRLRFIFLGQRARAETVVRQRQPGLVEGLVDKAIKSSAYREDFSRTLFQLLVPYDFKEAARQADRLVLVVDGYTANLPWEMIAGDDKPLAVRAAVIRQLASSRYRAGVRSSLERMAYVVGNPSTEGYAKIFGKAGDTEATDPADLPGAAIEAQAVAAVLRGGGFDVAEAPPGSEALDVINRLYRNPYRILHIAAHGVYNAPTRTGRPRSGVILSDGLLLSAAEIEAMEIVPDVVFLNCCFLGQVDREPVAYNRLAYSVGRELIELGVRAVVVAGWAVDDRAAKTFAEVFYTKLVREGFTFGDAVFQARVAVYESAEHQGVNTWGAYQAYGDPGFLIDPMLRARGSWNRNPVSPEELLDRIDELRAELGWLKGNDRPRDPGEIGKTLAKDLKGYPPAWLARPEIQLALGHFYRDMGPGHFEQAIAYYQQAVGSVAGAEHVPISAVEQLANLEARLGESTRDADRIRTAIARLEGLVAAQAQGPLSAERCAGLGSAYKRLASVQIEDANAPRDTWLDSLRRAMEWYGTIPRDPNGAAFDPYPVLNWLQLQAVVEEGADTENLSLTASCGEAARRRFAASRSYWDALMAVDAVVTASLLDGTLGDEGAEGDREAERLAKAYGDARASVHETERSFDSVIGQLRLLSRFLEKKAGDAIGPASRGAERLRMIAAALTRDESHVPGAARNSKRTDNVGRRSAPMAGYEAAASEAQPDSSGIPPKPPSGRRKPK